MKSFFRVFDTYLPEWCQSTLPICIGYSGGRDSHVLLHALSVYQKTHPTLQFKAIHVNHGLHPDAALWAQHCETVAKSLDCSFESVSLKIQLKPKESLEAVAREQRYQVFSSCVSSNQFLFTAHTLDDQAETFLLQALRGAGPKGLAGIALKRSLGAGILMRPLLEISREEIANYAILNDLKYINDPSNENTQFRRNFLRHDILPLLQSTYPSVVNCLARSAQLCAEESTLLGDYLSKEFAPFFENGHETLSVKWFDGLSRQKQYHLIRHWFMKNGLRPPALKMCEIILDQVVFARMDRHPSLALKEVVVKRVKHHLVFCQRNQSIKVIHAATDVTA